MDLNEARATLAREGIPFVAAVRAHRAAESALRNFEERIDAGAYPDDDGFLQIQVAAELQVLDNAVTRTRKRQDKVMFDASRILSPEVLDALFASEGG